MENIRLVATKNATDNHGMMSRMRAEMGIRQSGTPAASGFIVQNKIKKAINEYARTVGSIEKTISLDRMITRLSKYDLVELQYLHGVLVDEGVAELLGKIKLSKKNLGRFVKPAPVKMLDDSNLIY